MARARPSGDHSAGESRPSDTLPSGELRSRRLALALTQARLAAALGTTTNTVARWERGEIRIAHPEQVRLALERLESTRRGSAAAAKTPAQVERRAERRRPPPVVRAPPIPPTALRHPVLAHGRRRHNLPAPLTSFVGREQELASVKGLFGRTRQITLTGPGGVGKTRLALRVAADLAPTYQDGAWLVELASLTDAGLVPQAVAFGLGVREQPGRPLPDTLADSLRFKALLLVLDNCEHLDAACAELVDALLRACPLLHILATSRHALGNQSETVWRVPSLAVPNPAVPPTVEHLRQHEAIQLFMERAAATVPGIVLTAQTAPAVLAICHQLDGMPLAIELAATRLKLLSPEQLAARLGDRFRLLTGASRLAPRRQQTLRATLDWSFQLLSEPERVLFRRLAVFVGGWTLEAAEAVGAAADVEPQQILDLLGQLIDKSLVLSEGAGPVMRHRYLETIRQYALEHLEAAGELAATQSRHRDWCLRLGEHTPPPGMYTAAAAEDLAPEQANLRTALRWSIEHGDAAAGLCLGATLSQIWYVRGNYSEGQARLLELLALPRATAATVVRAGILNAAGHLAYCQGDLNLARALLDESEAISRQQDDQEHLAVSLNLLGNVVRYCRDLAGAQARYEEARAINHRLGNRLQEAMNLALMAQICFEQGDLARAEILTLEGLPTFVERGHQWGLVLASCMLGRVAASRGDHDTARVRLEECLERGRSLGIVQGMIWPPYFLAQHALDQGDDRQARRLFAESLRLAAECGDRVAMVHGLEGFASALAATQPERAISLAAAASGQRERLGAAPFPADRHRLDSWLHAALRRVGEPAYNAATAAGRELPLEQAVVDALALDAPDAERAGMAGTPRRPVDRPFSGLTEREVEVLRLVALAKTNREIATALVLSQKTVERHLSHIFAKLQVASRAGATRVAVRAGLA